MRQYGSPQVCVGGRERAQTESYFLSICLQRINSLSEGR